MLFNSIHFAIFFPIVLVGYFLLPHRWRWGLLLAASYYFYACWRVEYLLLLSVSTLTAWWTALRMGRAEDRRRRRPWMIISLVINLGILFAFKYANFAGDSLQAAIDVFGLPWEIPTLRLLLQIGISFYTFKVLSYTIDVYRGEIKPEPHLGILASYVSFFPQLLAGPIERSTRLLPQLHEEHRFDYDLFVSGLKLMLSGFFKKLVIADRVAVVVSRVYDDPAAHGGPAILLATYFFAFQIYCDFSAYSDIARGAAKMLGFDPMENFRRPYHAASISEFWRRWHISLSTWFRDYLYIPLGGNRVARGRLMTNVMVVFVVSGLWHGASWTFVVWGGLHGLYLVIALLTRNARDAAWARLSDVAGARTGAALVPLRRLIGVLITFHLVCFAWIFFRANSLSDASLCISRLFQGWGSYSWQALAKPYDLLVALCAIAGLELVHLLQGEHDLETMLLARPRWMRWSFYYAVITGIVVLGRFSSQEFIYFQF
jgi:alginate O-acetyltransferase complex protein AlgI